MVLYNHLFELRVLSRYAVAVNRNKPIERRPFTNAKFSIVIDVAHNRTHKPTQFDRPVKNLYKAQIQEHHAGKYRTLESK
jgi:hypothetical protein